MEALGVFKFWRNTAVRVDISTEGDDGEETNNDDSLFDLEFKSLEREEHSKKDSRLFTSKADFSTCRKPALRSAQKLKVFVLGLKKSQRIEKIEVSETPAGPVFGGGNGVVSDKSVPKYLKLIRPFYAKASSGAKSADPPTPSSSSPVTVNPSPRKSGEVSRAGSFKIMARSLGKSRSAEGAAPPSMRRRDEWLLEQRDDGIEGAILHCKKSFTNCSSHDEPNRNSCEERKRCSI